MKAAVAFAVLAAASPAAAAGYAIVGDEIPAPLEGTVGDATRGRAIVADRAVGLCVLCHSGPFPELRFQGDLAPPLDGAGSRWTAGQLRLRLVEPQRLTPDTIMPAYYRSEGFVRPAPAFAGRPILSAVQIEDIVAYLATLKEAR